MAIVERPFRRLPRLGKINLFLTVCIIRLAEVVLYIGGHQMDTKIVLVPFYNRRFPTSVDYTPVEVPRETIPEQRRLIARKMAQVMYRASQGMRGIKNDNHR